MVSSTANQICSETLRHASHFECYWKMVAVCIVMAMTRKAIVMATVEWPAVIEISGILVWLGGSMPGLSLHSRSKSCNQDAWKANFTDSLHILWISITGVPCLSLPPFFAISSPYCSFLFHLSCWNWHAISGHYDGAKVLKTRNLRKVFSVKKCQINENRHIFSDFCIPCIPQDRIFLAFFSNAAQPLLL